MAEYQDGTLPMGPQPRSMAPDLDRANGFNRQALAFDFYSAFRPAGTTMKRGGLMNFPREALYRQTTSLRGFFICAA